MIGMNETLRKAGVSFAEFADLVGVSRTMVYRWSRGVKPHTLRGARITALLQGIEHAIELGGLPIDRVYNNDTAAKARNKKLQDIIISAIKKSAVRA